MKPDIKIDITIGTLRSMTDEQFNALRNICEEGSWETADGLRVSGGGDYIGVEPLEFKPNPDRLERIMFLGIEQDGYTHS